MTNGTSDDIEAVRELLANAGVVVSDEDVQVLAEKRPKLRKVVNRLRLASTRDTRLAPAHTYPVLNIGRTPAVSGE